jgi:rod shape-determining protein MreD
VSAASAARTRLLLVLGFLLVLHFYVRPRLFDPRFAPDFMLVALVVYAIRSRPGDAAIAGFIVGLLSDALAPARFGAGALAHTVVGYLAAWGRAVFFADNLIVNAAVFAGGLWLRDLIVLLASGAGGEDMLSRLAIWSPVHALTTATAGVLVLVLFRDWLDIRLEE